MDISGQSSPQNDLTPPTSAVEKSAEQFAVDAKAAVKVELQRFNDAFGEQGVEWYAAGKSFAECQQLSIAALRKERDELAERLNQIGLKDAALLGLIPRA
ncbi:MAG TPA: hypothetical protein VGP76_13260 [Planctomycetaceae bacterium]|jgi:hypothetical protein|nr:hypothetical protein [Planctomycetaceae bacterium]